MHFIGAKFSTDLIITIGLETQVQFLASQLARITGLLQKTSVINHATHRLQLDSHRRDMGRPVSHICHTELSRILHAVLDAGHTVGRDRRQLRVLSPVQLSQAHPGREAGDGPRVWEVHVLPGHPQHVLAGHHRQCRAWGRRVPAGGFHGHVRVLFGGCDYKDHGQDTWIDTAACRSVSVCFFNHDSKDFILYLKKTKHICS